MLAKQVIKRHRRQHFGVLKAVLRFNQVLRRSRFLRGGDPDTLKYLKTRFLADYHTKGIDCLDPLFEPAPTPDRQLVASLFGGRFARRRSRNDRGRKRVSVRSIILRRQTGLTRNYERDSRYGLETVLASVGVLLLHKGFCRKLLRDGLRDLSEAARIRKHEQARRALMLMQKCIGLSNILQAKVLIAQAAWFRNFEQTAKSQMFVKKSAQGAQFIEVDDGAAMRPLRSVRAAKFARTWRRPRRFKRKPPARSSVPKNISKMYAGFLRAVCRRVESLIATNRVRQAKRAMAVVRTWTRRQSSRKPLLTDEQRTLRLRRFWVLTKCKLLEQQSQVILLLYRKFILLRRFGAFGCRRVAKYSSFRARSALAKLVTHNQEVIDYEHNIRYAVHGLSNLIFRRKTGVFAILHDKCKRA